mmetsp:Transcript_110931/g.353399  ORF Transcript_110931/g.353399 Transcript_110931/m.353399 type:complete len:225 (-) Transcript_110931:487-1161(-)
MMSVGVAVVCDLPQQGVVEFCMLKQASPVRFMACHARGMPTSFMSRNFPKVSTANDQADHALFGKKKRSTQQRQYMSMSKCAKAGISRKRCKASSRMGRCGGPPLPPQFHAFKSNAGSPLRAHVMFKSHNFEKSKVAPKEGAKKKSDCKYSTPVRRDRPSWRKNLSQLGGGVMGFSPVRWLSTRPRHGHDRKSQTPRSVAHLLHSSTARPCLANSGIRCDFGAK